MSPGLYRGAVRFFNNHAVNGRIRTQSIAAVLQKYNIDASAADLRAMVDAVSVDCEYCVGC